MTNSWAMLFDYKYGEDRPPTDDVIEITEFPEETFTFDYINPGGEKVVITDDPKNKTFWKYDEGKILREIEQYLTSTYNGHYVGDESKVQTLDLIDSIGDAEAFCRSNAIKYLSRFGKKSGKNRLDILKVIHYAILLYHFSDLPITSDETPSDTHSPLGY